MNNSVYYATRMSPFENLYGFHPDIHHLEVRVEPQEGKVPAATERARRMREVHDELVERWRDASESQIKYQRANQKPKEFQVGDKVLLSTKNLRLKVPKKKMAAKFIGPFRITDAVGKQAYRLALPTSYQIHNVFHVSLLEPWEGRAGEEPANHMQLAEDNDEWEVERIVDARKRKGKQYYLVLWKNWPEEYTSWEPEEHCSHAKSAIADWESQNPRKGSAHKRSLRSR